MRVVIMGGTSGIGLAAAEAFAADGAEVIVTGRDPEKLAAVKDRVTAAEQVDATAPEAVTAFLDRTGAFDHLVLAFSSGAVGIGALADTSYGNIQKAFEGKILAYLFVIQHAQVTGSITLVSAASARAALPGTVTLAAVNGAVERIVPPLAAELAPVRVNAVSPGIIDTPTWAGMAADQRDAMFTRLAGALPVGRVGTAADVAHAIWHLLTNEFVTGTVLHVDGGHRLAAP
jgi:NAD(P)-dependent dehydrogenase (short-subunit alcohol dehydrogenase family)